MICIQKECDLCQKNPVNILRCAHYICNSCLYCFSCPICNNEIFCGIPKFSAKFELNDENLEVTISDREGICFLSSITFDYSLYGEKFEYSNFKRVPIINLKKANYRFVCVRNFTDFEDSCSYTFVDLEELSIFRVTKKTREIFYVSKIPIKEAK